MMDIPKDKKFLDDSVQCNHCGGHGCKTCNDKGWLTPKTHPDGRTCEKEGCDNPIPPDQIAIYCTNQCAFDDA